MADVVKAYCEASRRRAVQDCIDVVQQYLDMAMEIHRDMEDGKRRDMQCGRALGASAIRQELRALLNEGAAYRFDEIHERQVNNVIDFVNETAPTGTERAEKVEK